MTLAFPRRVGLLGVVFGLSLGCSDDGGVDNPNGGGSSGAGTTGGSGAGTGGSALPLGGAAGSSAQAGGGAGGALGGAGASGGGMGGMGGMIDANGGAAPGPASGRHTARPSGSMPGTTEGFYEYLPPHYGNGALYPLLVFRHGVGENGSGVQPDLDKVLVHGPPKLIKANEWPETRPFVVLSVQHKGGGCANPQESADFLDFALETYDIDPKRVYLTGLSCGAIGTWDYLGEHSDEVVAAAVPICGNGRPAFQKIGCQLGKVPIWAFHGIEDKQVLPEGSTEAIASLLACTDPKAVEAKVTTYPGVAHDSWTMTYKSDTNDIYAWMLSHTKE